jgi:hypothetical protein
LDWGKLLKRAFAVDVLVCPKCSGPMRLVALIEDERVARKILVYLGLPARAPPRSVIVSLSAAVFSAHSRQGCLVWSTTIRDGAQRPFRALEWKFIVSL